MSDTLGSVPSNKVVPSNQVPITESAALSGNQIGYLNYAGSFTTESTSQVRLPAGTLKAITVNISSNSLGGATTLTARKNGVATAIAITVGAGATGQMRATGSVAWADGDLFALEANIGGTGGQSITFRGGTLELDVS